MTALRTKLFRDLSRLRGQVFTIALVVAAGVAALVTLQSTFDSLLFSRDSFYSRYRFGDVFAHLEAAPVSIEERLAHLPGVLRAETRIVKGSR